MSRTRRAGLCGLLLLLASTAQARDPVHDLRQTYFSLLNGGRVKDAIKYLVEFPYAAMLLAREPKYLDEISRSAADRAARIAETPDDAERLAAFVLDAARLCEGTDAATHAARADTHLFLARLKVALRQEGAEEDLGRSVAAFEQAGAVADDEGQSLARAVDVLLEMAALSSAGRQAALERAGKIAATLESQHKGSVAAAGVQAALDVEVLRDAVEAKRPAKEIAALAEATLEGLGPRVQGENADLRLVTAYNGIITLARGVRGVRLKADYVLEEGMTSGGELAYSYPRSLYWRRGIPTGKSLGALVQYAPWGEIRRQIDFYSFRWDTEYTFEAQGTGGDNPKGLATYDVDYVDLAIAKVTKAHRVTKGRLNRHIRSGYVAEVTGVDKYGQPVRVRSYYFKCERHKLTLNIYVLEHGDLGPDPEAEAFLESLTER